MVDRILLGHDDPIVAGHRLDGEALFPGLAYIDLLVQLYLERGYTLAQIVVRELSIFAPLTIPSGQSIELSIEHTELAPARYRVDVRGGAPTQSSTRSYATAEVDCAGQSELSETLDLAAVRAKALRVYELEECYARCRQHGLIHAGVMKVDGRVFETPDELLLELALGEQARALEHEFVCSPMLIDASAIGSGSLFADDDRALLLPLYYRAYRASARLPSRCYARIDRTSQLRRAQLTRQDISFFDEHGVQLGALEAYTNKLLRDGRLPEQRALADAAPAMQGEPAGDLRARLCALFARQLGCALEHVKPNLGYFDLGLDSAALLRLTGPLSQLLGAPVSPTLLFEYTTIDELAAEFASRGGSTPPSADDARVELAAPAATAEGDIAVIGMAGRYPEADDLAQFWRNLCDGRDCVTEVPDERWSQRGLAGVRSPSGKAMSRWGGFCRDVDRFDPLFFNISPREAELMDPQERLFLQACWEAIEDAGYTPSTLAQPRGPDRRHHVGVFAGVMHNDYALLGWEARRAGHEFPLSINQAPLANRVSFTLNLHGPSVVVDTVCSSSLTAVHLAVESLRRGESAVALAGGVNLSLHPSKYLTYGLMDMHASDGRCRSFGRGGDGYVSAEGCGVVLLKPLAQARADGDRIYGVIKASVINHGGRASGFTVPSPVAQGAMIAECIAQSGVAARSISYVEAHGTGTSLGDPIEVQGLTRAFRQFTADTGFCALGSVKSNIGHAESAAGISGLTKVLLQLHHRELVPSLHAEEENPYLDLSNTPFRLQRERTPWPAEAPRRAALSSFGAYGSNAHLIVEQAPDEPCAERVASERPVVIVLSARTPERLRVLSQRLHTFVAEARNLERALSLNDIAYTLQIGREPMQARAGFGAESIDGLLCGLEQIAAGEPYQRNDELLPEPERVLLAAFLRGETVQWPARAPRPRRVGLPTYPFARERYWLPAASEAPAEPRALPSEPPELMVFAPRWEPYVAALPATTAALARHVLVLGARDDADFRHALATRGHESSVVSSSARDVGARFADYARGLLATMQKLLRERRKGAALLQVISADEQDAWSVLGLLGMLRTLRRENPRWRAQLVMLDPALAADAKARAIEEAGGSPDEIVVRQRTDARDVLRWQERRIDAARAPVPYRARGCYLITGGAGGLGRIFAREIARAVEGATLILTGRAARSAAAEGLAEELAPRARVLYRQLDLGDARAADALIDTLTRELGALHGVIHAAGLHRDEFLLKKSWDTFAEVLQPKLQGTLALDRATAQQPLDFFVLCGSIAGALGNVGQVDYATANAFMAAFAGERERARARAQRRGNTVCIHWPLWEEGGMRVDAAGEAALFETFGVRPMRSASGLALLAVLLAGPDSECLVIEGSRERALAALNQNAREAAVERNEEASAPATRGDAVLHAKLCARLKVMVGGALKLASDRIESDAPWENYGIDSLLVTGFNRELSAVFPELPRTLFFEQPNIALLARYLLEDYPEQATDWCGARASSAAPATPRTAPASVARATPAAPARASSREPIAIVGMSGCYPDAPDLDAFWRNLSAGRDSVGEIPPTRWPLDGFFHDDVERAIAEGGSYGKWGAFVESFAEFDADFFGIAKADALAIDPQERLFLRATWQALEDGGYTRERLARQHRQRVGVFAGITKAGFNLHANALRERGCLLQPRTSFSSVANRVSYFFDLHGPSMPIDTMCSSSLTAIHEACENLQRGSCELAIAGGVNLYLHPSSYRELSLLRMLSLDGKCRSFGAGGSGFVPGEGVGVVLLKPLSTALRDGDRIDALIVGSHVNHGGKTNGYTVPSPQAQAELIREALAQAELDPRTLGYVEAHGTGTELGDPIEVRGLSQAFASFTSDSQFCLLGSAKSNIGHLEAAAGIAGLSKVVLQMRHGAIAPTLHADQTNPNIDFANTPFALAQTLTPWRRIERDGAEQPRRASVSSFGAGGANAYVLLEEYVAPAPAPRASGPQMIVLSARTPDQLGQRVEQLAGWLEAARSAGEDVRLDALAYTLQVGREAMDHRVAFLADDVGALASSLLRYQRGEADDERTFRGDVRSHKESVRPWSDDADVEQLLTSWFRNARLDKLLSVWCRGLNFDWSRFWPAEERPLPLRLPGYPFAKQRLWLEETDGVSAEILKRAQARTPLLAQRVTSQPPALPAVGDRLQKPRGLSLTAARWEAADASESPLARSLRALREQVERTTADAFHSTIELADLPAPGDVAELRALLCTCRTLLASDLPVLASLRGQVSTSGLLLALCSDLWLISSDCEISYDAVRVEPELARDQQRALLALYFGIEASDRWLAAPLSLGAEQLRPLGLPLIEPAGLDAARARLEHALRAKEREPLSQLKHHLARDVRALIDGDREVAARVLALATPQATGDAELDAFFAGRPTAERNVEAWTGRAVPLASDAVSISANTQGVVLVEMHERESKNTFSDAFVRGLLAAFAHIRETPAYKVVVLTGFEQYFACGGTRQGLRQIYDRSITYKDQPVYDLALHCDLPVIAAMQGHGLGVGWTLGLFSDLPVFSHESVFICSMMKYGFTPGGGSTFIAPLRLGQWLGREVQFTAEEYKGVELAQRGLNFPVLPRREVLSFAMGVAERLCRRRRDELIGAKAARVREVRRYVERVYERELELHGRNFIGNDVVLARIAREFNGGLAGEQAPQLPPPSMTTMSATMEPIESVREALRTALADELLLAVSDIDDDRPFMELGLDSITSVNWTKRVNARYGLTLVATKVYQYATLRKFAEHVQAECQRLGTSRALQEHAPPLPATRVPERAAPRLEAIDASTVQRPSTSPVHEPIAVIGMTGRFPGADDLESFWQLIRARGDGVREIPAQRWSLSDVRRRSAADSEADQFRWMGALDDVDCFDPLFFQITPAEAAAMDPQQRIFLEQAYACCEDAGYAPSSLSDTRCGVFVGTARNDYGAEHDAMRSAQGLLGANSAVLAARIAYCLNLKGPALAIDTACSSSLVAIAMACNSLLSGECDAALAGGVWVMPGPDLHIMAADAGMLSRSGRCYAFDDRADGYVPGEGVGVLLLKRIADAERDGDNVLGVIAGWGTNQDGRSNGLTAPNQDAQARLQTEVYERFAVDVEQIQLLEAHGTGTRLGDPIEVEALTQSFRARTARTGYCALGSVKSNIGHLLTAAGVASVIKVLLALEHRELPATAQFQSLNPNIELRDSPFYVATEVAPWRVSPGQRRMAAVNSFGVSGTNAHVVIAEAERLNASWRAGAGPALIVLSARNRQRLVEVATRLARALAVRPELDLHDVAYTLQVGRAALEERAAWVVASLTELRAALESFAVGDETGAICGSVSMVMRERPDALDALLRRDLPELARLWVSGAEPAFAALHAPRERKRLRLPSYPFARERYWLSSQTRVAGAHPLLELDLSSRDQHAFAKRLQRSDFYLRDHVIAGEYVLPGVVHLEFALAAAEQATGQRVAAFHSVLWGRRLCVAAEGTEIVVRLSPRPDGWLDYQICDRQADGALYSHGLIELTAQRAEPPLREVAQRAAIRAAARIRKAKGEIYALLAAEDFLFGPSFQRTEELACGEREALAELVADASSDDGGYTLHPAMLDASLRSFLGILGPDRSDLELRLPFSLETLRIRRAPPRHCFAHATVNRIGADGELSTNISITDVHGAEVVEVVGLVAKRREPRRGSTQPAEANVPRANEGALAQRVEHYLFDKLVEVTRLPRAALHPDTGLEQYGVDSITVMKLNRALSADFKGIPGTLLFEHGTIRSLTSYFLSEQAERLSQMFAGSDVASTPPPERTAPIAGAQAPRARDDIAVIGIAGRYPGADDLEQFWQNLLEGRDCIEEIPRERWDYRRYYAADARPGTMRGKWGGFIRGVDEFDAEFFDISPSDAALMDPQVRLLLQTAWHAIEDSGYTPHDLCPTPDRRVGVFAAVMWNEYQLYSTDQQVVLSNNAFLANRISFQFDFRGPSAVIDTGCSSSLQAIALACASLRSGESSVALAGGVNLSLHPNKYLSLGRANLLSSDGRCRSYGAGGDGQVPGEGVGCVVLKRLSDALRDGDTVYGVIRAAVVNHGGRSSGLMVPNLSAQAELVSRALDEAGLPADQITYVEGHGTGTQLGDPIEVRALSKAFSAHTSAREFCALGSVKSNLGHLEAASGVAALSKVLLQLRHGVLVPSLHAEQSNPLIELRGSPFRLQRERASWPRPRLAGRELPRACGIGSFGAGGANAYLVIEEHVADAAHQGSSQEPMVVPLSARTERALRESAERLLRWLEGTQDVELSAVAHTLQRGRVAMAHRLAIVASSLAELRSSLTQYLAREVAPDCFVAELRGPHAQSDGEPSAPRDREACRALARAWAEGHATRWPAPRSPARRISLPGYPFARVRHWLAEAREQPRPARAPYDAVDGVLDAVCNQSISIDDAVGALLRELSFGEPLMH